MFTIESAESLFRKYQEKYNIDFHNEFYIKELIKLKLQFYRTPDSYIETKINLLTLMSKIEQILKLEEKENVGIIPLVDESIYKYNLINSNNNDLMSTLNMTQILKNKLKQGRQQKKLIDITGFRGIGKTTELINFAKNNNFLVIVPQHPNYNYKSRYGYKNIYHHMDHSIRENRNINCVVDEGVDINRVKNELRLNIITGYYCKYK